MSTTLLVALCAVLFSGLALASLALRDPKRLRAAARLGTTSRSALRNSQRSLLGWVSIAPGLVLALGGQWTAFLIWLGASIALGWTLAQSLSPRPR